MVAICFITHVGQLSRGVNISKTCDVIQFYKKFLHMYVLRKYLFMWKRVLDEEVGVNSPIQLVHMRTYTSKWGIDAP